MQIEDSGGELSEVQGDLYGLGQYRREAVLSIIANKRRNVVNNYAFYALPAGETEGTDNSVLIGQLGETTYSSVILSDNRQ